MKPDQLEINLGPFEIKKRSQRIIHLACIKVGGQGKVKSGAGLAGGVEGCCSANILTGIL